MYIEPIKRIKKAITIVLKATKAVCYECGNGLSLNRKGSTENKFRSRCQTLTNIINQSSIDWDDIDEDNVDEFVEEIEEIGNDMKIMANPNSWEEVVEMQLNDAETIVKKFTYYN